MNDIVLEARVCRLRGVMVLTGDMIAAAVPPKIPRPNIPIPVRSMDWVEMDIGGACPSYERVLAAHAAWKINPDLKIVISGGRSNVPGTEVAGTTARLFGLELEALGLPRHNIVEEGDAFNSLDNISACARIAKQFGWAGYEIGIISMGWHLTRVEASINHWSGGNISPLSNGTISYLSAERLLIGDDPKWVEYFRKLDATPQMQARRAGESRGIEQILTGLSLEYGQRPYRGFEDPLAG